MNAIDLLLGEIVLAPALPVFFEEILAPQAPEREETYESRAWRAAQNLALPSSFLPQETVGRATRQARFNQD